MEADIGFARRVGVFDFCSRWIPLKTNALNLARAYEMAMRLQTALRDRLLTVACLKFLERWLNGLVLRGACKLA